MLVHIWYVNNLLMPQDTENRYPVDQHWTLPHTQLGIECLHYADTILIYSCSAGIALFSKPRNVWIAT